MAINSKPFLQGDRLIKTVFKPNPTLFTAEDVNRELERLDTYSRGLSLQTGALRENLAVNITSAVDTIGALPGDANSLAVSITISKVNAALDAFVYYKGVRLNVPFGTTAFSGTFNTVNPNYPVGYLALYALRNTVTFGDDPVMCGVTSTEYPFALPSCEVDVYSDETLRFTDNLSIPYVVGADTYDLVCIVATIVPKVKVTNNAITYLPETTILRQVRYNATLAEDFIDRTPFEKVDDLLAAFGYTSDATHTLIETNEGNADNFAQLVEYLERKSDTAQAMFTYLWNDATAIKASIVALTATVSALSGTVSTLLNLRVVQIGMIVMYSGTFAGKFDVNGTGISVMVGFQICNGYGGVPDLRGRFIVGAINGVPSSTGDPTAPEVDPTDPDNENYNMSDTGGEGKHLLTSGEMPSHTHGVTDAGHTHTVTDAGHVHGVGDTGHAHGLTALYESATNNGVDTHRINNASIGAPLALDTDTATTGITINSATTGVTVNSATTGVTIQNTGSGQKHNNLPPYYALAYLIRIN
jgi:microcystin-dependent protein